MSFEPEKVMFVVLVMLKTMGAEDAGGVCPAEMLRFSSRATRDERSG
jgi:hypothetical protein